MTMTREEARASISQELETTRARIATIEGLLEPSRYCTTIAARQWIVADPTFNVSVAFNWKHEGRKKTTDGIKDRWVRFENATRYGKEDAAALAATLKNGAGEAFVALHWEDALERELADLRKGVELRRPDMNTFTSSVRADITFDLELDGRVVMRLYIFSDYEVIGSLSSESAGKATAECLVGNWTKRAIRFIRAMNPAIGITFEVTRELAAELERRGSLQQFHDDIAAARVEAM